uniref:Reverse transcriptase domain-containing protein n=1 Tax=Cannabis sativa TaxID=3483 RepID=A0A803NTP6_CANSA
MNHDHGTLPRASPYFFFYRYLIFPLTPDNLHYVPFWVQVYGIPFMCKSHDLARFIAMEVGDLIEIDKDTIKEGTGPYMRIRILLDVNLPLRRGMNIKFIRMGREFVKWLDFKFERLPDFCFFCGKLDHTKRYCVAFLQKCDELYTEPLCPYSILLRGKEKIIDKSQPFQYPHPPTITMMNYQPVNLNLPPQNLTGQGINFPSFLSLNDNFPGPFVPPTSNAVVMMPTPLNPNLSNLAQPCNSSTFNISLRPSAFTSYSTDSVIVAASHPAPAAALSVGLSSSEAIDRVRVALGFDHGLEDNAMFHFTCYYGSPISSARCVTWELLDKLFYSSPNLPWLIMGNKYTWHNNTVYERLDWAVGSESWRMLFPNAILHHLPFYGSDHRAIKIVLHSNPDLNQPRRIKKRFQFENIWLDNPSFYATIRDSWNNSPHLSNSLDGLGTFLAKQNSCVTALSSWHKSVLPHFQPRIQDIQREITRIQSLGPDSSEHKIHLKNLQSQLDALLYKEEIYWKQRSRVSWLKAGDRNTKFFHRFASHRKKNNTIRYLKDDAGNSTSDPEAMFDIITSFFSSLFSSDGCDAEATNHILDCLGPPLDDLDYGFLAQPFTAHEVKKAVFSISGDKAPGLDGLNAFFYQKNWAIFGNDLTSVVLNCLNGHSDFSEINSTLIVLIPKKQHANAMKDFRPISLCSTLYKIISKAVANRLKVVLDKVISPFQSAFVSGRVIFDNILIAQELIHAINARKVRKRGWAALKLDMAKAFDRVEWHFLGLPVIALYKDFVSTTIKVTIIVSVCGDFSTVSGNLILPHGAMLASLKSYISCLYGSKSFKDKLIRSRVYSNMMLDDSPSSTITLATIMLAICISTTKGLL